MKREIKFRGKSLEDGRWLYGDLYHAGDLTCICDWTIQPHTVENFANIGRIINGKRYSEILTAGDILEVYPTIVAFTQNKTISKDEELKDYCLGLCGEIGEFVDEIKKKYYHGKEVNPTDLVYELGDVLYYLVAICNVLGFDFHEIALNNNAKLIARYPDGFSTKRSNERIEEQNLDKLADREKRGVIVGDGDNR